ncbi:nucleotidyltransferase family protein [Spirosoma areae]
MEAIAVDQKFILEKLRANRERLRTEFGIEQIGLYGSFARNEQTEKSDIDLVYNLVKDHHLSLIDRDRLQRVLKKQIRRKPDLINQRYMNPFTKYTMLKDVIYV